MRGATGCLAGLCYHACCWWFFDIGTNLVPGNEGAADRDRERISRFGFRTVMCGYLRVFARICA